MKIVISFFDNKDRTFKKTLFGGWDGDKPILVAYPKKALDFWSEKQAESDIKRLESMTSPRAKTLSVKLERL
ncbi:hypothetical protein IGI39_001940 [Enterococcus sp. AZ135]|uniref:hypothetical protein n=1 Tax=unclassified Enterococcus TaxID=2608891 RepID=UPI003F1EB211